MKYLPVITASNQAFVPGLQALLTSLSQNSPIRNVHVLDCGIETLARSHLELNFPNVNFIEFKEGRHLPASNVGSNASYARLYIGDYFEEYSRVLYIDADTVVLNDLEELDVLELRQDAILAACIEHYTPTFASHRGVENYSQLGFNGDEPYFNSGVLLIDVQRWNEFEIKKASITYLLRKDVHINLFDQEAINVSVVGKWQELNPCWNVTKYWMKEDRRKNHPNLLDEACIAHFISQPKPWDKPDEVHPWLVEKFRMFATQKPNENST